MAASATAASVIGYGGLGFGGLGFGFGYPFWGLGGLASASRLGLGGWGGWGWGGWGRWCGRYPFNPGRGRNGWANGGRGIGRGGIGGGRGFGGNQGGGNTVLRGQNSLGRGMGQGAMAAHHGVQSPPSSRPYGNPFHHGNVSQAVNRTGAGAGRGQFQRRVERGGRPQQCVSAVVQRREPRGYAAYGSSASLRG